MRRPLLFLLALFGLASCQGETQYVPETLVVSVLPDQSREELSSRFAPLMSYLQATTGQSMTLVLAEDYSTLLQSFIDGEVHLAFFGGSTFVRAEAAVNADPLVMRDVDVAFRSCYVTVASDPRSSVVAFEASPFSFGSSLSTSGHLMPRYFMQRYGIVPEEFFSSIEYSRTHFETAQKVIDGSVELGVMNCFILEEALGAGTLAEDQIRILAKTPAYVNYTWAIQNDIDEELKKTLVDAFLALDITKAEHEAILTPLRAHVFLPAGHADFEDMRRAVMTLSED